MSLRQFIVENFTLSELLILNSYYDTKEGDFNYYNRLIDILVASQYFSDFNSTFMIIKSIIIHSITKNMSVTELKNITII